MNMHERMAAGKLFTDLCEGLPEERARGKRLMAAYNATDPQDAEGRAALIAQMLAPGSKGTIEPPIYFCYGSHIHAEQVYINMNCTFLDDGCINIGKKVLIASGVTIATVGHPVDPELRKAGYMYCDDVTISDGVWIGANATICPGVTIGENSVIGAGSVVTKDIPANVVAVGNPCRVLREIGPEDKKSYYHGRVTDEADLLEADRLAGKK